MAKSAQTVLSVNFDGFVIFERVNIFSWQQLKLL